MAAKIPSVCVAIVLLVGLSMGVPLLLGDGTSRFSGVERDAAVSAITFARGVDYGTYSLTLTRRVEAVILTPPSRACSDSAISPVGSPGVANYSVVVSYRSLFGIMLKKVTLDGCRFIN